MDFDLDDYIPPPPRPARKTVPKTHCPQPPPFRTFESVEQESPELKRKKAKKTARIGKPLSKLQNDQTHQILQKRTQMCPKQMCPTPTTSNRRSPNRLNTEHDNTGTLPPKIKKEKSGDTNCVKDEMDQEKTSDNAEVYCVSSDDAEDLIVAYEKPRGARQPKPGFDHIRSGSIVWARINSTKKFYLAMVTFGIPELFLNGKEERNVFWFATKNISKVKLSNMEHFTTFDYRGRKNKCNLAGADSAITEILNQYNMNENQTALQEKGKKELFNTIADLAKSAANKDCSHNIPPYAMRAMQIVTIQNKLSKYQERNYSLPYIRRDPSVQCLCCKEEATMKSAHPLFDGLLCEECAERVVRSSPDKPEEAYLTLFGNEMLCSVCSWISLTAVCRTCFTGYCTDCTQYWFDEQKWQEILQQTELSMDRCPVCDTIRPEKSMKNYSKLALRGAKLQNIKLAIHRPGPTMNSVREVAHTSQHSSASTSYQTREVTMRLTNKIRVLSLFDGLSVGLVALKNSNINVEAYFASEIDANAITVSIANHGELCQQIGDIKKIDSRRLQTLLPIDLLIGGSPCDELSHVNHRRKGIADNRGTGPLFFEFARLKNLLTLLQGEKFYFLFENVSSMDLADKATITRFLETDPVVIDASRFTAMKRRRLYWTNIPHMAEISSGISRHDLQNYLSPNLQRQATVSTVRTVTTNSNSLINTDGSLPVTMEGISSALTLTEIEQLFGLPAHYTDIMDIPIKNRRAMLGKAWSAQVIEAILRQLIKANPQILCKEPKKK